RRRRSNSTLFPYTTLFRSELIDSLSLRQKIVTEIGKAKAANNVTPLQLHRMGALMEKRIAQGSSAGLSSEYVKELFDTIHEESVDRKSTRLNSSHVKISYA